ncbi:PQQ-binding-like beta-propeller repeat protein [Nocardia sp. NBC_00565]|uniref:outer membrane protein assembly factor BamB family protein n=1 Tax=Nocardia sp. NBC_00565 TaxID=2975993 RepID=UPI002E7FEEA9|nr:PQQ-binding-like beta-propeller repeat protein [Nocardia sp. NBC_00565]WUC00187.1 PQQ-binding-like beta-propeller repeat protein [Nocardia sp. NBC_00565]
MRSGGVLANPARGLTLSRLRTAAALAAVGALALAGCGTDVDDITVGSGKGWTSAHHDGRNDGVSPVTGSRKLSLSWSRPVGGPIEQAVTIGPDGQLFLTTLTPNNCAILSLQMPTGRKRFCNPLGPNAISAPPVVDSGSNVYVGDDGGFSGFNSIGQPRWRTPVAGVPVSAQFTGDGKILTITQSGQVDVLSRQTGERVVGTTQLLGDPDFLAYPDLTRPASGQGLDDCTVGGPQCPVANISPIDTASGRFFVTLWKPGKPTAALVALRYADNKIQQDWSADLLAEGSATSPTLSADGRTVYVGDNTHRLIAVDAADGHTKWVQTLEWAPRGGISVAGDGLIIPAGDDGHLLALRDNGDSAEVVWERKDLALRGTPVQTAGDTGYTAAAIGDGINLITFDTKTGATVDSDVLPDAKGTTTGTSVGAKGEVVLATRIGEVFIFKPDH